MVKTYKLLLVLAGLCLFNINIAHCEDYVAVTTGDQDIPIEDLRLLLKPLTKSELQVEVVAWQDILKVKVLEVSQAEIKARNQTREIRKVEQKVEKNIQQVEKAQVEDNGKTKDAAKDNKLKDQARQAAQDAVKEIKIETETPVVEAVAAKGEVDKDAEKEDQEKVKELEKKAEEVAKAQEALEKTIDAAEDQEAIKEKIQKVGDAQIELQAKVKEGILNNVTKLQEQRTAVMDRFIAAVDALENKGGQVEEYRQYVTAISGITVDIEDVGAARQIIVGWLLSSEGGLRWLKNFVFFALTLLAFYVLSKILGGVTRKALSASKKSSDMLKQFFVASTQRITMIIGVIIALAMLEVNVGPLVASIGAAGFILAFALQGTLSNFASGLMILMYRPYDIGNVVEVAGVKGIVDSMNLVSSTIKTFDNQMVIVPNGSIWGGVITNVTGNATRRVDMVFGISYTDDIGTAQEILEDIVNEHELVLDDPEPVVRLHELGDSSMNFVCRPWSRTENYWKVYWDVTRSVKEKFDAAGVSIPFPQRDVHIISESNAGEGETS